MRFLIALLSLLLIVPMAQAQNQYKIKSGDLLRIEVLEDASLNREALVLPDGRISVPLAGTIQAGGRTVDQVRSDISQRLASNFATPPTVYVGISLVSKSAGRRGPAASREISIYVLGEVSKPGKIEVKPGTTILQLFAQMGGFSNFASTKRIQLRRTSSAGVETVHIINYRKLERGAALKHIGALVDGDVIIVPQRRLFE